MIRRLALATAILAALILAAEPAAADRIKCRINHFGIVICIIHKAEPPRPIPRAGSFVGAPPTAAPTLPSTRTDGFGIPRLPLSGAVGARPFGEPPRPAARPRVCQSDSFGIIRCL